MKDHYKVLIRASWVVLLCCFLIKIFGGNYFEIAVQNKKFISICNYVDNTLWLKMILAAILYCFGSYFYFCITLKEKKLSKKHLIIFIPLMVIKSLISWDYYWIAFALDFVIMIIIPILLKANLKTILKSFLLINAFQIISMFIKNISLYNFNENIFVIQLIYQIDYYIMIFLYYLNTFKRKEE